MLTVEGGIADGSKFVATVVVAKHCPLSNRHDRWSAVYQPGARKPEGVPRWPRSQGSFHDMTRIHFTVASLEGKKKLFTLLSFVLAAWSGAL